MPAAAAGQQPLRQRNRAAGFYPAPATQTGANTLGFVLDGRVWRDYGISCPGAGRCDSNQARVTSYYPRRGEFTIYAGLTTKEHSEYFYLYLRGVKQPGTYAWRRSNALPAGADLSFNADNGNTAYYARPGAGGSLTITRLDTVQQVISGVFSGVLRQAVDSTKTLTITNGRFDLRYR